MLKFVNRPKRLVFLAILALSGFGLSGGAMGYWLQQNKTDNDMSAAKAALKEMTLSGNKIESQASAYKIAALDASETKDVSPAAVPTFSGEFTQGSIVFGQTLAGATVMLDTISVPVDADGWFVLGFTRDHPESANLTITTPDGTRWEKNLTITGRKFNIERIDGLPDNKVSTYTDEELARIGRDKKLKTAARARSVKEALWRSGFAWPVTGRISGEYGSQRILNGIPKRMHSGVDVAAPEGTDVLAPADGIVTLAQSDMYFEGGLVFLDHGQQLESVFMHMSRVDVKPGDRIKKGDVIGAVGMTGRATGPHLHWSMNWHHKLVDPRLVAGDMQAGGEKER